MSRHDHTEYQAGCFRCDLSRDEVEIVSEDRTHFYGDGCCVEPGDSGAKLGENSLVEQARELLALKASGATGVRGTAERLLAGLADEVERLRDERDDDFVEKFSATHAALEQLRARVADLEDGLRQHRHDVSSPESTVSEQEDADFRLWALLDAGQTDQGDET
jgi:hypothetical protein